MVALGELEGNNVVLTWGASVLNGFQEEQVISFWLALVMVFVIQTDLINRTSIYIYRPSAAAVAASVTIYIYIYIYIYGLNGTSSP